MTTVILYSIAGLGLIFSLLKSRGKTKESARTAGKMLIGTIPQIVGIMALIGLFLALIPADIIKEVLGGDSEILSTIYGAVIGAITIIPAFIAFPLSKSLVESGAYIVSVAAFLTTLTMVGFATFPIEVRHFGAKFALSRNILSLFSAIGIAMVMGVFL